MSQIKLISIRENPLFKRAAIQYFQEKWAHDDSMMVYENCISYAVETTSPLPHWYLLFDGDEIIGGAGLITNDFISRMDLYPWICALYIEKEYRGNHLGRILIDRAIKDAKDHGFNDVYLCTDHIGYYEKYGFSYIGDGYHPWGESSRIYHLKTQ